MESSQNFKTLQESIQSALISTTRLANQIAAEDLSFQRTSNPTVAEELDETTSRFLTLTSSLLRSATRGSDITTTNLEDADDIDVHWSRIVDVLDNLLEKADTCLDEYTGAIKRKAAPADQPTPPPKKGRHALDQSMRRANVLKPQTQFEVKPNNHGPVPWKPILTKKPHATLAFEKSIESVQGEAGVFQFKHPYETEILALEYPQAVFEQQEPIPYTSFEETTATFVDTFEGVLEMLEELKGATVIAIDTEHHDFRTYNGLLSLMQISTRDKDWIVDTLQPWRHKLEVLNEVFADPNIIKVLHGAYMDIVWLQRDCGLYIVGLFDTFEAADALHYPGRSLAYLLKRFVDFDADKKYQLADWRIRPLPEEMLYYARSDTHYLLYVYDNLRNEILSSSQPGEPGQEVMARVLHKSKLTSLRQHESVTYDAEGGQGSSGWFNLLVRNTACHYSREQFSVFRAVHQWRDELARKEDESPLFVLSNHNLIEIAKRLPPDQKALHGLLDPGAHLAKKELSSLFAAVSKAMAEGSNGPSVGEVIRGRSSNNMGIGEVARQVFPMLQNRPKDAIDVKDLISETSQLWGNMPMSSLWDPPRETTLPKQTEFELPWARFVNAAKLAEDAANQKVEEQTVSEYIPTEVATPTVVKTEDVLALNDQKFTLKAGKKRKATEQLTKSDAEEEPESKDAGVLGEEEIAIDDEEEKRRAKKAKKAEKKARKAAKREAEKQEKEERKEERKERKKAAKLVKKEENTESNEGAEESEDEPFDYSKAKSVLKSETKAPQAGGPPRKNRFNPYGMTAEGPKPARKMHGEKAGKSATFKR